jgi:A/G-specific adenine glycosylase
MDLGSGICTPRQPDCPRCPLRRYCKAFIAGTAACYPISGAKRAPTDQVLVTALFTRDGSVLMRRRAIGGLWSGLWEPPSLPVVAGRLLDGITNLALQESVDLVAKPRSVGATRHQLTHRSLTFRVYSCEVVAGGAWLRRKDRRWCTPSQLAALAISTAHRKVLAHLRPLEVRE